MEAGQRTTTEDDGNGNEAMSNTRVSTTPCKSMSTTPAMAMPMDSQRSRRRIVVRRAVDLLCAAQEGERMHRAHEDESDGR
jgi:hypothetical protein